VKLFTDFKKFLFRGNVVDLAVAIVVGTAFTAVVKALVSDLITPIIAMIFGSPNFGKLTFTINSSHFAYGDFLNNLFTFASVAAAMFFLVVTPINWLMARRAHDRDPAARPPSAWRRSGLGLWQDRHHAPAAPAGEVHGTRRAREQRVVLADADAVAGLEARAALAHDDLAAGHGLPGEHLDAQALGVGVAAVARRAQTFLMRHCRPPRSCWTCSRPRSWTTGSRAMPA
jgi:large conductance mechanosensitive channel